MMTQFQGYMAVMAVMACGIGLSIFGWVCHQPEAVQLGGLCVGGGLGWIGLKRPQEMTNS